MKLVLGFTIPSMVVKHEDFKYDFKYDLIELDENNYLYGYSIKYDSNYLKLTKEIQDKINSLNDFLKDKDFTDELEIVLKKWLNVFKKLTHDETIILEDFEKLSLPDNLEFSWFIL